MKAAIYGGKEHIEVRELPTPVWGPEGVRLKTIDSAPLCVKDDTKRAGTIRF